MLCRWPYEDDEALPPSIIETTSEPIKKQSLVPLKAFQLLENIIIIQDYIGLPSQILQTSCQYTGLCSKAFQITWEYTDMTSNTSVAVSIALPATYPRWLIKPGGWVGGSPRLIEKLIPSKKKQSHMRSNKNTENNRPHCQDCQHKTTIRVQQIAAPTATRLECSSVPDILHLLTTISHFCIFWTGGNCPGAPTALPWRRLCSTK